MPFGTLPTPIADPALFPFEPNMGEPVTETLKYVTDIISAENDSEQRISLRVRPGITVSWNVLGLNAGEAGRLAGLLYTNVNNRWYVPLWYSRRVITAVAGGVYTVDETVGAVFEVGGLALVWKQSDIWDVKVVTAVGPTSVTLSGTSTFVHTGGLVAPLAIGSMTAQNQISRMNMASDFTVTFEIERTNSPVPVAAVPTQLFEGKEVLNIHPSGESTETESWTQSSERVGGVLGPVLFRPLGPTPVIDRPKNWVLTTNAEIAGFRAWIATRRGRWRSLWVPTYTDDLTLVAPVLEGATTLDIAAFGFGEAFLPVLSRTRIALLVPYETVLPFRVTGVAHPSVSVERLQLALPVPQAVPQRTRCCFLVLARLSSDEISLVHEGMGLAVVKIGFTELPREVTT